MRRTIAIAIIALVVGLGAGSAFAWTAWTQAPIKARTGSFLASHGYCQYEDMVPVTVDYPGRRYVCKHIDEVHDLWYSHR